MNTDGFDNYQKSLLHQAQYLAEAEQHRLAQPLSRKSAWSTIAWQRYLRPALVALIVLIAAVALFTVQPTLAHDTPSFEPGMGSLFHDSMLAFTLGNYHFHAAHYDRALDYFEQSIELLPAAAFELAPQDYANLYRMLGHSQSALGLTGAAQESFAQYLVLADNETDPVIVAFMNDYTIRY
jgi:tetratricopeptide (TPR) repeat protein